MTRLLMPLADGFEEIETVAVIDILRRAGIEIVTSSLVGNVATGMHNIKMQADTRFMDTVLDKFDGLVFPGGMGNVSTMLRDDKVISLVRDYNMKGKLIAAICGAPEILVKAGVLKGKRATCAPGFEKSLDMPRDNRVVADANVITSQGPGTAIEFALKIVEMAAGKPKADMLKKQIIA